MGKDNNVKIAMTAGILSMILLILVGSLLVFNTKENDDDSMLEKNIKEYASSQQNSIDNDAAVVSLSGASSSTEITDVSGNSFYITKNAVLKDVYNEVEYDIETQLNEMFTYWSENNMAAVSDLAHLERYEAMSYKLKGTDDFLYYGEKDQEGRPNGKGLAVYRDNCYYFGDWYEGMRQGTGTWINFYPAYSNYVVAEHLYMGEWTGDLPFGEGQEHYDYNSEYMNDEDIYLQNAIGKFKNGKYDGEMYIIQIDPEGYTSEWIGTCVEGKWVSVKDASKDDKGKIPVLTRKDNPEEHIYMTEEGLKDNMIGGIITGGKIVDM